MAGGDARVSRVDVRRFEGFSGAEFHKLVKLPAASLGQVDTFGCVRSGAGWCKEETADAGRQFWATALSALRLAGWRRAEGARWGWTERSSQGGKAQLLICHRITWVFSDCGSPGRSGDASQDERWMLSTYATQHIYLTK
eukprot:gnl/TRDRNA2_/TRDRNA2_125507_c0_seq3.p1 gnl/TRDRNA2_/TRDRNA2_125507_c0~~gnl/TRDRNA2_/TRDRNA2_125507_c0_seq3.p1  ORF type:complete len:140 (-),score=28.25 gnl/TRDRNA2_/TRDRNA2_125507_c0_seq3:59-478(-)